MFEKLPAFFACAAWMEASGFELPLEQPASETAKAVARSMFENGETEQVFIFMATNWPLGDVANWLESRREWFLQTWLCITVEVLSGTGKCSGGYLLRARVGIG